MADLAGVSTAHLIKQNGLGFWSGQFASNHAITSSKVRAVKLLVVSVRREKKPLSFRQRRETVEMAQFSAEA